MALSLATDLAFGQPAEHMVRSARIGMRLGERLGLDDADLAVLYDVSILTYVGCPVFGDKSAALFGDDIDFRANVVQMDLAGFDARMFMMRRAGSGGSAANRVAQATRLMATGGKPVMEQMANHCAAAGLFADRLGLAPEVRAGLEQAYARWDGKGVPSELRGDGLALAARVSHVAEACEVVHRLGGLDEAVEMVQARTGTHFDPAVAAAVSTDPDGLFAGIDVEAVDEFLDAEPVTRPRMTDDELDHDLAAIGDFCDLRCTWFAGHCRGTAALVAAAGELLSLAPDEARLVHRAALVHDLGRFGVPGTVWNKPGPLSATDQERMRLHVYYVERIFQRPDPLRRIGLLAATHHERMDGSGYHRGIGGPMLSTPARLLAAADAYHAMTQPRPHRDAFDPRGCRARAARRGRRGAARRQCGRRGAHGGGARGRESAAECRTRGTDGARSRRARAARAGAVEQGDRVDAGHQRQDRRQPRRARVHQARRDQSCRRRAAGDGARDRRPRSGRRLRSLLSGAGRVKMDVVPG